MKSPILFTAVAALSAAFLAMPAISAPGHEMHTTAAHSGHGAAQAASAPHTGVGIVRRIDAAQGKVTLQHEPIESLGWPAMTMAFRVKDPAALAGLRPGARVRFAFVQEGADYVITSLR